MDRKDFKILFIHGYTASSRADFYPALSPFLNDSGVDFVIPDLPGGDHPHAKEWLETIHETVKDNTKQLIIVGHSLGTRTALLYVEKFMSEVKMMFLFAAFANRIDNALRRGGDAYPDFFEKKVDIAIINQHVEKKFVIHSLDDSSIPYEQGVEIAQDLHGELITFKDKDHFSSSKNAPTIFSILKKKIGF